MTEFFAPDRLETPEFTLRSFRPGDGRLLQEATNSSYEHLRTFMWWAKPDSTLEEQERIARNFCARYLLNENFALGVFTPDESRLMGWTGFLLHGRPVTSQIGEIGMWISAQDAGKGLGTRILTELLRWGFTAWPWHRLEWKCDTINYASASVARKAGMQLEATHRHDVLLSDGTWRDTYVFSMLRSDYERSTTL